MERTIITRTDVERAARAAPPAPSGLRGELAGVLEPGGVRTTELRSDSYLDRLVKYIPTEIIAAYVFLDNVFKTMGNATSRGELKTVVFLILLVMTPLYLWRVAKVTKWVQIALSTGAFFVWVLALGGPPLGWFGGDAAIGAIVLPLYTLLIPIVQPDGQPA